MTLCLDGGSSPPISTLLLNHGLSYWVIGNESVKKTSRMTKFCFSFEQSDN
nr:MAG TPA: hypothetical protein [Caudoviricetes sp.]